MSNFSFLKPLDQDLYEIINEAEKLYRDEYFEQSIVQTRRFAENICKNVLGNKRTTEKTFDDMLATLKDKATHSNQEKEFIEDLYFIKKEGNSSAHSNSVKKNGIIALECIQRSFEIAINYAVYYQKAKTSILKKQFDIDLLVTGKTSVKPFVEKYKKAKKSTKTTKKTSTKIVYNKDKKPSIFWNLIKVFSIISFSLTIIKKH